jgi:hypothetical protein
MLSLMTRLLVRFRLLRPPDEEVMKRISDAHSVYGILRVKLAPSMDQVSVEYDATRLRPAEVDSALASAGIPVERLNLP